MEITSNHWAIIINPKSGKKQFRQQRKYLFLTLKHAGIRFDYKITKFAGHAIKIAKHFAQLNYRNFLVVGGDGTISELINGIFSANIADTSTIKIALIPRGTGNDWGRFWGLTNDYKHSIDIFLKNKTQSIDIGKINYELEGEQSTHYFINSVGFGLDAAVARNTNRMKRYVGSHSFLYTIALLGAVFTYRTHKAIIKSKEKIIEGAMFTMNVANGCYSGGGMKQNPNALPYDGLLDVMLAKKPTFKDILFALTLLFNGKLLQHPVIESFQTSKLTLQCEHNGIFEADGIVVNCSSPIAVEIIPKGILMIVP
ncbi:MAG: diacylglycerol kinase family lipid kinase [Paludibacter sp.]|nr:diacylglycerol kinase family lipid kinase [Paludibacter sp.]